MEVENGIRGATGAEFCDEIFKALDSLEESLGRLPKHCDKTACIDLLAGLRFESVRLVQQSREIRPTNEAQLPADHHDW